MLSELSSKLSTTLPDGCILCEVPNPGAGGYFFGCVPDGKAIMSTLQPSFPSYKGQLLQILAEWKGTPRPFGSAYSMAIGDTVTQGNIALALKVWG